MRFPPFHPLLGAELRVERAGEHIEGLRGVLQEWADGHSEAIDMIETSPGVVEPRLRGERLPVELIGRASVFLGDTLTNLRAALDYLVYVCAYFGNGGQHVTGTQFPIDEAAVRRCSSSARVVIGFLVSRDLARVVPFDCGGLAAGDRPDARAPTGHEPRL